MKKIIIAILLLTTSLTQAQQEVKLDIFDALGFKTIELSYENYINDDDSVGISLLINSTKRTTKVRYNEDKMITPYFRHYFSSENQINYFGEVFFGLNFGEKEITTSGINSYKSYTDGALGVAVGGKYNSDGGLTLDFYVGIGRNLFSSDSRVLVPRIGANIGYRF